MKTSPCADHQCSDSAILERPRYFPRQLITPGDLTLEATYFRDKLRRHNRLLHGWGVVCGALVCPVTKPGTAGLEPWKVQVESGYILGPYGDEILIDCARPVDLRSAGVTGMAGEPSADVADPWCSQVFVKRDTGQLWVAVKYKEIMTRPVRIQPVGCGCDDSQCEYSRWRDGYEIGILTRCPASQQTGTSLNEFKNGSNNVHLDTLVPGSIPTCPPCPEEAWVVLARVDVDGGGAVTIDNCDCRRLVVSFGSFWWKCMTDAPTITSITGVDPEKIEPSKTQTLTIHGTKFKPGLRVIGEEDVHVDKVENIAADSFAVTITVGPEAAGPRLLTVVNPDCSLATTEITITSQSPSKAAEGPASTPAAPSSTGVETPRTRRRQDKP